MAITAITIVVEPPRVSADEFAPGFDPVPTREFYTYDTFAAALQRHTQARVSVVETFLRDAPQDGLLLLHPSASLDEVFAECSPRQRASLPTRVMALNLTPAEALQTLDQFHLAGAIDVHRYFAWREEPDQESGWGVYGRKTTVEAMGGNCETSRLLQSERYCRFTSARYADLPSLLAGYLEAYHAAC